MNVELLQRKMKLVASHDGSAESLEDQKQSFLLALHKQQAQQPNRIEPASTEHAPIQSQSTGSSAGSKIIMLGDSGSEYACSDMARFCGGSRVVNMGASGSTADAWAKGSCPPESFVLLQGLNNQASGSGDTCNAAAAFER